MDNHTHDEFGNMVLMEPEPELEPTEAAVQIAQIQADRDVALAKINKGLEENLAETDLDVLRAENRVLREQLEAFQAPPIEPEPEIVPVIIDAPDSEPEATDTLTEPEATDIIDAEPKRKPVGLGMW